MSEYYIEEFSKGRRRIALTNPIARGAAGTIHRVTGEPNVVAKLYIQPRDCAQYRDKVAAMIATPPKLPPFVEQGREYVQIAWPAAMISDGGGSFRGFLMSEVDTKTATELENILQKSMRRRKNLPEFYGGRALLAANMASLMAELHTLGHYMIDMKPSNMRFYPHIWYMAILDTDGFSVNGPKRFPARQFSDDYIAPEAQGKPPEVLGIEQDQFALSVIIFQLLNNGVHPFQGIDRYPSGKPTTKQERIFAGMYAYGVSANPGIAPATASIHDYLEPRTRQLFDRAFLDHRNRPTAVEWRDHLMGLINGKLLMKCAVKPAEHAHFSKGCGLCALENRVATVQVSATTLSNLPLAPRSPAPRMRGPRTFAQAQPLAPQFTTPQPQVLGRFRGLLLALGGIFVIAALVAMFSLGGGNAVNTSTVPRSPSPPPISYAPPPPPQPVQRPRPSPPPVQFNQPPPVQFNQQPQQSVSGSNHLCLTVNGKQICD